jgi:hypothetical protein
MTEVLNAPIQAADVLALLGSLGLAVALSAAAGLRAWLPLLVTGILGRLGLVQVGDAFSFVTSTPALITFGVATALEIGGDKVPALDHALDVLGTFIRPASAALLAASVMFEIRDPLWAAGIGIVLGAPIAAVPHAAKSTLRLASTGTTLGLANPFLSLLEDFLSSILIVLGVVLPIAAVLLVGLVAFLVLRRVGRPPLSATRP